VSGYGILNDCRTKIRFGVVEAINSNIKTLFRRGRGYKNLGYLLFKAQRMAVTKTEFIVFQLAPALLPALTGSDIDKLVLPCKL
jgi:hypothetical protein